MGLEAAWPRERRGSPVRWVGTLVGGAVLFALARKLVWGHEEALDEPLLWTFALLPYAAASASERFAPVGDLVRRSSSIAIWTVSLSFFVFARGFQLPFPPDEAIYRWTESGPLRYAAVTVLYVLPAAAAVIIYSASRYPGRMPPRDLANKIGAALGCCVYFWLTVLFLPIP